jgi:uncharacterized protein YqhQ
MSENSAGRGDPGAPETPKEESKRGAVGGQAVIEGVMMKSKDNIAIAVRRSKGEIVKKLKPFKTVRDKHKILNAPVLRGFVNFIEMMKMAMGTLNDSAEMLGLDEEIDEENKKKKEQKEQKENKKKKKKEKQKKDKPEKKSNSKAMIAAASVIGTVLGLALSLVLFFMLPTFIGDKITEATGFENSVFRSIAVGITRFAIFLAYILLVSLIPDIRRTFQYHGAEHMSIYCHEAEKELTVENVKQYSRFHPRCGTSFIIVMMLLGIIISMFIPNFEDYGFSAAAAYWLRLGTRLAIFPFVIGIGYEFIKYAGKHDSAFVKIVSAPGIWMQTLTTRKPDDKQIEVAVVSLRAALEIDPIENMNVEVIHNYERDAD